MTSPSESESIADRVNNYYREYGELIVGVVHGYVRRPDVIEEIVQETFLRAMERGSAEKLRQPKAWLLRVARNRAIDYLRAKKTEPFSLADDDSDLEAPPRQAEFHVGEMDSSQDLENVLGRLPANYREVLRMHYLEERSYEEIANRLGLSRTNAKVIGFRARNLLRRLEDIVGHSSSMKRHEYEE